MSQSYNRGLIEDFGRWREFSAGMWAWIFHKFTGWVLIGYLFTHIAVLSTATANPGTYTATIQGLEELTIVRIGEVGLLAVAVFHILNGVRLLFVDLGVGLESQDKSFYASLIVTAVIVLASVPTFMQGAF
ncbi:succinate dehydrogenase, cytochrome b556 subunit [Haladaptatus paucihalophilus DX253]|uniref:Succinate dehydrogenase subunit C n=1 Tax=Haladaptatus paucihalophilus DX253 TaxID=797209 RepID=E7QQ85_HALPU|nr:MULTISPECIES: succinate dehydrogenase, cytochrome b556 subunit [Haladaptatus]EFW93149.1 succinate dehydrogenase, cytochrome b556 subunit [Haladaptatus paucihalophilus DX253]ODR79494.1 succinate dehydrogenase, cytochrome b556 subunit [Haladaptatus sp. W1]GKZ12544.1 succinate dehydrogenase [Haladaptatus sp. T7]SHK46246.1 succinate dehydrogenase subunit C [Haladaptatus paucihalophilus DX253]